MASLGKLLILAGCVLVAVGGLVWLLDSRGGAGLPGDITFEKGNFRFYFPVATCLVVSLALTLLLWLFPR
jgi:hypothetical protein